LPQKFLAKTIETDLSPKDEGIKMTKQRKLAARSSKRGATRRRTVRKAATKHVTLKKAQRPAKKTSKERSTMAPRGGAAAKTNARNGRKTSATAPEFPIETTIIDVIEEPAPGVFIVSEFEEVRVARAKDKGSAPKSEP
jgi:hypothetical protein